jgi:hypothetical protein
MQRWNVPTLSVLLYRSRWLRASLRLHDLNISFCSGKKDRLTRWSRRALRYCVEQVVVVAIFASFGVPTRLKTPAFLPLDSEIRNHLISQSPWSLLSSLLHLHHGDDNSTGNS